MLKEGGYLIAYSTPPVRIVVVVVKFIETIKVFFTAPTIRMATAAGVMLNESRCRGEVLVTSVANMMHAGIVFMSNESFHQREPTPAAFAVGHGRKTRNRRWSRRIGVGCCGGEQRNVLFMQY